MAVNGKKWEDPMYLMFHYKTEACSKYNKSCNEYTHCPHYHTKKDRRRMFGPNKYTSTPCVNVKVEEEWKEPGACHLKDACGNCHTRMEQQFHPEVYKKMQCNDMKNEGSCPRGLFCAFAHNTSELPKHRDARWDYDWSKILPSGGSISGAGSKKVSSTFKKSTSEGDLTTILQFLSLNELKSSKASVGSIEDGDTKEIVVIDCPHPQPLHQSFAAALLGGQKDESEIAEEQEYVADENWLEAEEDLPDLVVESIESRDDCVSVSSAPCSSNSSNSVTFAEITSGAKSSCETLTSRVERSQRRNSVNLPLPTTTRRYCTSLSSDILIAQPPKATSPLPSTEIKKTDAESPPKISLPLQPSECVVPSEPIDSDIKPLELEKADPSPPKHEKDDDTTQINDSQQISVDVKESNYNVDHQNLQDYIDANSNIKSEEDNASIYQEHFPVFSSNELQNGSACSEPTEIRRCDGCECCRGRSFWNADMASLPNSFIDRWKLNCNQPACETENCCASLMSTEFDPLFMQHRPPPGFNTPFYDPTMGMFGFIDVLDNYEKGCRLEDPDLKKLARTLDQIARMNQKEAYRLSRAGHHHQRSQFVKNLSSGDCLPGLVDLRHNESIISTHPRDREERLAIDQSNREQIMSALSAYLSADYLRPPPSLLSATPPRLFLNCREPLNREVHTGQVPYYNINNNAFPPQLYSMQRPIVDFRSSTNQIPLYRARAASPGLIRSRRHMQSPSLNAARLEFHVQYERSGIIHCPNRDSTDILAGNERPYVYGVNCCKEPSHPDPWQKEYQRQIHSK